MRYSEEMAVADGDRTRFFPLIEKKHGGKISEWIERVKNLGDAKYPEQIAFLKEEHGFSQAHANALVMYVRGSTSSTRHDSPAEYFKSLDPQAAKTMKAIFGVIQKKFPQLELVLAWNQPMLRIGKQTVFGMSASKNHLAVNPFSKDVLDDHSAKLSKFVVNKHTFQVPIDWTPNASLLHSLVKQRLKEIDS
jgi:uncharacterized protein YdhG (YjbR/CyaY superfamily)